jgi:adenylate cyclase
MIYKLNLILFLETPVALMYFLFIILSILHLDYRVNIFAGLLAAIQYAALTYFAFNYVDTSQSYVVSSENSHYLRAVILILSGGAAAFVSAKLKNRIKTVFDFQQAKNELEFLFGQQVSREVSKALIEEKGATKRLEATIMFLDIRNFTSFADAHTAEEVIDYQNKFLSPVIDIINQHQGVVFQILGDGLMACFGSPVENVLHADMAFQSSLEILKCIQQNSEQKVIPPTTIGIGLHTGMILAGNIGNEQRKQFSISGAPVIVASRIEQLNKKFKTQLLISGQVYKQIAKGNVQFTYLGEEPLRGIGEPVDVYNVILEKYLPKVQTHHSNSEIQ